MKRLVLFFLLIAIASGGLEAQSLDECQALAREHYPEIKKYDLINLTRDYNLSNASRSWIPQITFSAQGSLQTETPEFPGALSNMLAQQGFAVPGMRKDQYKVAIDVSQNIWDGGQARANRSIAESDATEQRSRVDVTLYDLRMKIENLYFGILLLDEKATQIEATLALLERNLRRMQAYRKSGVAMSSDVDAVEAELLATRQTLGKAISSRTSYRRMLELFIGRPLAIGCLIRPAFPELNSRIVARPELALFDAQKACIEARRTAVRNSLMPRISVFAQGYYGYPTLDMFKSMMSAEWRWNALIGLRVSWNIGAFYTKRNNIGKLDNDNRNLDVQRDVFLFNTQMQTTQEEEEINRLRNVVADDEKIVSLRRSIRVAAESQLENGVIDTTDLLRKITDENTAVLGRSTHEIELLQATYRLKHTLNQ